MPAHGRRAPGERITVSIPAGISALIPPYLARRRSDLTELSAALERGEFEPIETIGHRMSGNGASMGFPTISAIGAALEVAAQAGERDRIERLRTELADFLDHVDVVYD